MSKCRCDYETCDGTFPLLLPHFPHCKEFGNCVKELIVNLVRGMESWSHDEDGIHPDAWEAYKQGKIAIGESVSESQLA